MQAPELPRVLSGDLDRVHSEVHGGKVRAMVHQMENMYLRIL